MTDDLKEVDVEEMDYQKKCGGSDTRFTGERGFYSEKFKGMIFQKGNLSDYVGKIRLTRDFSGTLPNGSFVDLRAMKLRDVFVIYPELKESWGSRGCSDYWNFSDKTISFYVRIDKAIQPQFPINESYYLDKPIEGIDLVASCYSLVGPTSKPLQLFRPDEPMYFIDSIRTNESFIKEAYQPSEFAAITVVKGDNAIKIAGQEGKNGSIFIYAKSYAREKYFRVFKSKSFIDHSLKIYSNLSSLWVSGGYDQKVQLQDLLFPGGILFDKQKENYRTEKVNSILELTHSFTQALEGSKKGQTKTLIDLPALVVPPRIELGSKV